MINLLRLIFVLIFINGCSQEPSQNLSIKVALNIWPGNAHVFVAQKNGFFEKYGISVEIILKNHFSEVTPLYKFGEVDAIFSTLSDTILLNAEGFPTQVVYTVDYSDSADVIIGHPNINSLFDLRNKTVAFEGINTFSHLFVLRLLDNFGIKEGEFYAKNISAQDILTALDNREIDAGHTWEPVTSEAIAKGYKVLGKAGDSFNTITDVLSIRKSFVEKHPKAVQAMIAALVETQIFLQKHPKEAIPIMADAENMSIEEMLTGVEGVHYLSLAENIEAMKSGGQLFDIAQYIVKFYKENGSIMVPIDTLDNIINAQFVQALEKETNKQ